MIHRLLTSIAFFILFSCEKDDNSLQRVIYEDVINETFLRVTQDFKNLSDLNEVIVNPADDHLDSIMVQRIKNDTTLPHNPYLNHLFSKLEQILNEPLDVDLKDISSDQKFRLIDDKEEIAGYDYEREAFTGSSFISKIALDDDEMFGVFYIDVQFGDSVGSSGQFVFVERNGERWRIDHIMKMWH